jgi:Flp pilus assembly pilin Flp
MFRDAMVRLIRSDEGMEMVEWSLVGVIFALAGALVWSTLNEDISSALSSIASCVSDSASCK